MSAKPTRLEYEEPLADAPPIFALAEGGRVLDSLAKKQAVHALHAFSAFHEQVRLNEISEWSRDTNLLTTEQFVLDEVLQLICERIQIITRADGVLVALADTGNLVCRAAAGTLIVDRDTELRGSEFLGDSLTSGRALVCDDCDVDGRVEDDISVQVGARSTVLVPLRGRWEHVGVLQVFSNVPFAFGEQDTRSLELFGELILSALKPEDEDRRVRWLAQVIDDVLKPRVTVAAAETSSPAPEYLALPSVPVLPEPQIEILPEVNQAADFESVKWSEAGNNEVVRPEAEFLEDDEFEGQTGNRAASEIPVPLLANFDVRRNAHPGLVVVLVLVCVAALFSIGVYWGVQDHHASTDVAPHPVTRPGLPKVEHAAISDNLFELKPDALQATAATPGELAKLPKVTGIRHWSSQVGSTVVIDMQDQVPYEVHRLASPERIYFDLRDTSLASDMEGKTIDIGDPSLKRVRIAQPVSGVTRIVLDTRDGSNFAVSLESSPYRLVVQLRGAEHADVSARVETQATSSNEAKIALSPVPQKSKQELLAAKLAKFRIVLDAGHGGWDLGTVGRQGLLEKDLVLDVTQRLGKLLASRLDAEVEFTRTKDTYLPLDQRADLANQLQADLFVSVHANYSSVASARGVETYYTNTFSAPGVREAELKQVAMPSSAAKLSPGELHEKIQESRRLAASVQRSLYAKLANSNPGIRDRGIKDASFVVLTGTTMPSILTEISFVSSPADERNLQSAAYRQEIAEALYKGIAQYESSNHRVKLAQAQPDAMGSQ